MVKVAYLVMAGRAFNVCRGHDCGGQLGYEWVNEGWLEHNERYVLFVGLTCMRVPVYVWTGPACEHPMPTPKIQKLADCHSTDIPYPYNHAQWRYARLLCMGVKPHDIPLVVRLVQWFACPC